MNIDEVYKIMRFIARKNQLESLSPAEFEYAFNSAQRNYYDFLIGRIEQYRYDKPIPRVGISMTDAIYSRLSVFLLNYSSSVSSGTILKPIELNKILRVYTENDYTLYRIEPNRLSSRIHDSIDPIDEQNAFYVELAAELKVYPTTIPTVYIDYLSLPQNVVWAYTLDVNGRPVWDEDNSVSPQWKDNDIDEIIGRALKILGVSIKESALINYGQQVITQGE